MRSRQSKRTSEAPKLVPLSGKNAQVRSRVRTTQENETGSFVFRVNTARFGLIDAAFENFSGTGCTPTLKAHIWEIETSRNCSVEKVLVGADCGLDLPAVRDKSYLELRHLCSLIQST